MRSLLLASCAALPLLLASCAVAPVPTPSPTPIPAPTKTSVGPLQGLAAFTITDLQNALAIAQAGGDQAGVQCYTYLIPIVQQAAQQLGNPNTTVSGAFSAFETGRVVATNIKGFINGVPQGLNLACAPLVVDSTNTLVLLGAQVGVAITVPAAVAALPLP